ncbi:peptidoglycan-recognition protein SA [Drosophila novamexicana]|uniref:peptidoglycan-recognition protein SA n=1 Tax=Drosophila novamexicana TaxID=47314 RepID=UPI0011E58C6D|nr:peptidoglycan-recognition protein SA [Drosophila novamexicana]
MSRLMLLLVVGLLLAAAPAAGGKKGRKKGADCPQMKLKRQWGGKPAHGINYQVRPVRFVVIHHTVTSACSGFVQCAELLQGMQSYHQTQLDYHDIGYNFLIGNDGIVYEGTGWGIAGAHTYGYNANGTGIAFIGNYVDKLPAQAALDACKKLLACGVELGELSEDYGLIGGSQVISTQSPGLTLYNEIQEWPHWLPNP